MHNISITQLAGQIYSRKELGEKPYLLFLGAGVSISSGVSGINEIINQFLINSGIANYEALNRMDRDERFKRFVLAIEKLNESDRYSWLQACFRDKNLSLGYHALTRLIEEGYFDIILTTNWDNLLELSLKESSRINKEDYQIYIRGEHQDDLIIRDFQKLEVPQVKILKLHGDLAHRVTFVTPKEATDFPGGFADFFKNFLRHRDLIMIGYSVSDLDIQKCIDRNDNTLIYVAPQMSPNESLMNKYRYVQQIDAEFNVFMNNLCAALLDDNVEKLSKTFSKLDKHDDKQHNIDLLLEEVENKLNSLFEPAEGQRWLHTPLAMLDGRRPIDLITHGDADRIMQILVRLEEGIHI
ncbi:SIR2 family protein [candidate division KSB1 bacterium]|nr:SIR2 family protein [candidate division KSB1 bacterium]